MSCLVFLRSLQSVNQDLHGSYYCHARAFHSFRCAVTATGAEQKKKISFSRSLTALNFLLHLPLPRLAFLEGLGGRSVGPMTSVTLLWRLSGMRWPQNAAELTGTLRTFSAALKQERHGDLLSGPLNKEHLFLSSWPPSLPRKAFRRGGLGAPSL